MKGIRIASLALTLFGGACASRGAVAPQLPAPAVRLQQAIDSILDTPPLDRSHWGVHIVDARTGDVVYSRNAERHFIPASNQKLVPVAAALAQLGPEFRYRTSFYETARMGDSAAVVVAAGSGDPTWSARFFPTIEAPFDSMAQLFVRGGVRAVGELLIDVSRFADAQIHPAWEVADLPWSYAPPVDAFAAAEGTFRIVLRGGATAGVPGSAEIIGPVPQPVRATVHTVADARAAVSVDYTARRDTIYITATLAPGAADTSTLAVTRPAVAAAELLRAALDRAGVRVHAMSVTRDSAVVARSTSGAVELGAFHSPPLRDIAAAILRPSQNWITEQLLKTLGAQLAADGSWRGGVDVSRRFLIDIGIDSTAFLLRDGSGLTVQNLLSPAAVVSLLTHARAQPWGTVYRDAMAAPALAGSTLNNRLRDMQGRVFAKTGSVTNVNTLSGYVIARDGREYAFSIMNNASGIAAAPVRAAIDAILLSLN